MKVCPHASLHEAHLKLAARMRLPMTRIVCIAKGTTVPVSGRFGDWLHAQETSWTLTTKPLATDPERFHLKQTMQIHHECSPCGQLPSWNPHEEDMWFEQPEPDADETDQASTDEDLALALQQTVCPDHIQEQQKMMAEDKSVCLLTIKRTRDTECIQYQAPLTIQQLTTEFARKKRVKLANLMAYLPAQNDHQLDADTTVYMAQETKRGGMPARITTVHPDRGIVECSVYSGEQIDERLERAGWLPRALAYTVTEARSFPMSASRKSTLDYHLP